ncbi:MAG TPA: helix-turn-helix transcriptional regulator [Rhodanobacteraceae bacterium]
MPAKRLAKSVATQFGIELRNARSAAKLTQQVLAERADIDPVFVSLLENGHRQPSLTVLLNLERVLGLEAGELSRRVAQALHDSADATRPKGIARHR